MTATQLAETSRQLPAVILGCASVAFVTLVGLSTASSSWALSLHPALSRPTMSATSAPRWLARSAAPQHLAAGAPLGLAAQGRPVSSPSRTAEAGAQPLPALLVLTAAGVALWSALRPTAPTAWSSLLTAGQRPSLPPLRAEDWDPSKGTSLGDLFGSSTPKEAEGKAAEGEDEYYKDLEISSEAGVDYSKLKQLLVDQEWELADNEHRRLLIELAGPAAVAREYVWPNEVKRIPEQDMKMLDQLWLNYSGGKFGFSVQRRLWAGVRGNWMQFFKRINWVQGEGNDYRKWPKQFLWTLEAEKGHLPLTNTLRGTGLITAVFEHPAFGGPLKNKQVRK